MPGISFRYCDANYKVTPDPVGASLNYWSADFSAASNIIFSNGLLDPWHAGNLAHLSAFRDISLDIFDLISNGISFLILNLINLNLNCRFLYCMCFNLQSIMKFEVCLLENLARSTSRIYDPISRKLQGEF